MTVMLAFMKTMFVNGKGLAAWIALLLTVNMALSLVYIGTLEGQVVLAALLAGAVTQTIIFSRLGFVRLLGVGHVYWIPMLPWLWTRLGSTSGLFEYWLMAVIALDGVSLVIDVADVARYARGERTPHLTTPI